MVYFHQQKEDVSKVCIVFSVHLSGSSWRGSKQTRRRWRRQCRTGGAWRRSGASCRDHRRHGPRSSSTGRSSSILSGCECDQRDSARAPGGRQTGRGPLKIVSGVSKIESRQGYEVLWATIQLERVVASLIWSSSQTDWSNPYCCSKKPLPFVALFYHAWSDYYYKKVLRTIKQLLQEW